MAGRAKPASPPGIGHNQPPEPLAEYSDNLNEAIRDSVRRLNDIALGQKGKVPEAFTSVDQAIKGINLAIMLQEMIDGIDKAAKEARKPLDERSAIMRRHTQGALQNGQDMLDEVREKITKFMAGRPTADRLRTDHGDVVYTTEAYDFSITDPALIPRDLTSPSSELIKIWIKSFTFQADTPEKVAAAIARMKEACPAITVTRKPILTIKPGGKTK